MRHVTRVVRAESPAQSTAVAEIQGLYGAFSFPEKLLQKVWLRGDFNRAAACVSTGQRLHVLHPGKWNLLGGPDFRGARLRFGDEPEIVGDVEVHLQASDWDAHGHARDRAYDGVVLHVVLFPPDVRHVTRGADGRALPILALLPLLHHDLEEFAAEDAVERLANRPANLFWDELAALSEEELNALLRQHATARWRQKIHFARLRLQRLGWEAACHHMALEVLGYRFNRAPMLRIAGEWALGEWAGESVNVDEVYAAEVGGWALQGVRPANHPRHRLQQYAAWTKARPDWPGRLMSLVDALSDVTDALTREVRRKHGFTQVRKRIAEEVTAGVLGGTRLDNFICDGVLPPLAVQTSRALQGAWQHWFVGDQPLALGRGLRQLAVFDGRGHPASHGMMQGLLGWLLERETRA